MTTQADIAALTDSALFSRIADFANHMDPGQKINRIVAQWLMESLLDRKLGNSQGIWNLAAWMGSAS